MRISFVLSSLWLSGGVQVVIEYANRLTARGHHVTLVVPGDTLSPIMVAELAPGVDVRTSRMPLRPPLNLAQMARLTWSLAREVPASDVVIATHTPTTAVSLLACYLLRRGRPVWFFMDYQEMFAGRPYELWLMRHALRWHKRALVLSDDSRQELAARLREKVTIVGLGLSHPEILQPRPSERGQPNGHRRAILFLGDTRPRKGLSDFMQAAAQVRERLKEIELWIASKQECQIVSDIPFKYVHRPTRAELAQLYATCDLYVSASWREGFGLPPLEAMACGAPVVLTDSGGVREYARTEENCLMVPARDPVAMAEAMIRVLTDAALAERLRRNGPPTAARFTWDAAVDRFEAALVGVLARQARNGTG